MTFWPRSSPFTGTHRDTHIAQLCHWALGMHFDLRRKVSLDGDGGTKLWREWKFKLWQLWLQHRMPVGLIRTCPWQRGRSGRRELALLFDTSLRHTALYWNCSGQGKNTVDEKEVWELVWACEWDREVLGFFFPGQNRWDIVWCWIAALPLTPPQQGRAVHS